MSLSKLLAALTVPIAGALADRTGNGRRYLFHATAFCCLFTLLLGGGAGVLQLVLLFILANYLYEIGLVFYNALLPSVTGKGQMGTVSGWGVSLGYLGSLCSVLLVKHIVNQLSIVGAFYAAAILFLVCSLPQASSFPRSMRVRMPASSRSFVGLWWGEFHPPPLHLRHF